MVGSRLFEVSGSTPLGERLQSLVNLLGMWTHTLDYESCSPSPSILLSPLQQRRLKRFFFATIIIVLFTQSRTTRTTTGSRVDRNLWWGIPHKGSLPLQAALDLHEDCKQALSHPGIVIEIERILELGKEKPYKSSRTRRRYAHGISGESVNVIR